MNAEVDIVDMLVFVASSESVASPESVAIAVSGARSAVVSWSPVAYRSHKLDNSAEVDMIYKSYKVGKFVMDCWWSVEMTKSEGRTHKEGRAATRDRAA